MGEDDIMGIDFVPELKPGLVISDFDGSYDKKQFIVSLNDRNWTVSEFVRDVLTLIDGTVNLEFIHGELAKKYPNLPSVDAFEKLINDSICKNGFLINSPETASHSRSLQRFFWLKLRVIKAEWVEKFSFLGKLFNPILVFPLLIASMIIPSFLIYSSYTYENLDKFFHQDFLHMMILLFISSVVVVIHEFGHMAACMRYKIKPGHIGFAIYFMMPVLYSSVSRAWSLKRGQRVWVDIGGIYFESIALSLIWILGITFNIQFLILAAVYISLGLLMNLNPFIKMDGYWILSDASGIPNLHQVLGNFFQTKLARIFGKKGDSEVSKFRKSVRIVFYIYVALILIFIAYFAYILTIGIYTLSSNWMRINEYLDFIPAGTQWPDGAMVVLNKITQFIFLIVMTVIIVKFFIDITLGTFKFFLMNFARKSTPKEKLASTQLPKAGVVHE